MTFEEVEKFFKTSYQLEKIIGIQHTNWNYWKKKGYVPLGSQLRIEKITNGKLKASFDSVPPYKDK